MPLYIYKLYLISFLMDKTISYPFKIIFSCYSFSYIVCILNMPYTFFIHFLAGVATNKASRLIPPSNVFVSRYEPYCVLVYIYKGFLFCSLQVCTSTPTNYHVFIYFFSFLGKRK